MRLEEANAAKVAAARKIAEQNAELEKTRTSFKLKKTVDTQKAQADALWISKLKTKENYVM